MLVLVSCSEEAFVKRSNHQCFIGGEDSITRLSQFSITEKLKSLASESEDNHRTFSKAIDVINFYRTVNQHECDTFFVNSEFLRSVSYDNGIFLTDDISKKGTITQPEISSILFELTKLLGDVAKRINIQSERPLCDTKSNFQWAHKPSLFISESIDSSGLEFLFEEISAPLNWKADIRQFEMNRLLKLFSRAKSFNDANDILWNYYRNLESGIYIFSVSEDSSDINPDLFNIGDVIDRGHDGKYYFSLPMPDKNIVYFGINNKPINTREKFSQGIIDQSSYINSMDKGLPTSIVGGRFPQPNNVSGFMFTEDKVVNKVICFISKMNTLPSLKMKITECLQRSLGFPGIPETFISDLVEKNRISYLDRFYFNEMQINQNVLSDFSNYHICLKQNLEKPHDW